VLKKRKYTIAFISWMVFITFSSLSSFEDKNPPKFDIPHLDKAVHFTFYFVAVILSLLFVREVTKGHFRLKRALLLSVIGAILFGIVIEALQHGITADRQADVFDAVANSFGAIIGAWGMKSIFSREDWLKWKN